MFWKNVILYEIYSKKIKMTEYFLHVSVGCGPPQVIEGIIGVFYLREPIPNTANSVI